MRRFLLCLLACCPAVAFAQEGGIGLDLDLGYATAYVWRGLNVFQDESQKDQNMLLAPGITWNIGDTGLWLGYWSAWQITGPNISDSVQYGASAEQDLLIGYDMDLTDSTWLSLGMAAYVYPLADGFPKYLEPSVTFGWSGPVDLSLQATYITGLGEDYHYFYALPAVAWSTDLTDGVGLELNGTFGYKIASGSDAYDKDLLVKAALPVSIGDSGYVSPSVALAWTNLAPVVSQHGDDLTLIQEPTFADGLAPYAGVNVGTSF